MSQLATINTRDLTELTIDDLCAFAEVETPPISTEASQILEVLHAGLIALLRTVPGEPGLILRTRMGNQAMLEGLAHLEGMGWDVEAGLTDLSGSGKPVIPFQFYENILTALDQGLFDRPVA